jgi:hypothetical protein
MDRIYGSEVPAESGHIIRPLFESLPNTLCVTYWNLLCRRVV